MIGDLMRALLLGLEGRTSYRAREVLRKHAPCLSCGGKEATQAPVCEGCNGRGFSSKSVEAAIARAEGKTRCDECGIVHAPGVNSLCSK